MQPEKQLSAGELKIFEYVERIQKGESKEEIFKDLPRGFIRSIEEKLGSSEGDKIEQPEENITTEDNIPTQYEGLPAEIVEELWTIPIYVDSEKTKQENQKKQQVIVFLKQKEKSRAEKEEKQTEEQERVEEIKGDLGISNAKQAEKNETDPFGSFSVKNGETDVGAWWYEYRNQIAKEMKKEGKFEWGKERLYFDIPLTNMTALRDLVMTVSSEEKIPIAFKHLDEQKSFPSFKDGNETRFVANFSSAEDALRFYLAIRKLPEYQSLHSDRNMSYGGYRAGEIAEYSNGYRESRDALKRIMNGTFNKKGEWEWEVEGVKKNITKDQYEVFRKKFEELNTKILSVQQKWEEVLGGKVNSGI